jgi:hypothetical protein
MRSDPLARNWWEYQCSASIVGVVLLLVGPLIGCAGTQLPTVAANSSAEPAASCGSSGTAGYVRTELFFGKSIPGGGTVTDAAFDQFLDQEVTPVPGRLHGGACEGSVPRNQRSDRPRR